MEIPASVAIESALTRQAIALEVIRGAAKAEKQIANILEQSAETLSAANRGRNVNITA